MSVHKQATAKAHDITRKDSTAKSTNGKSLQSTPALSPLSVFQQTAGNQAALMLLRSGVLQTKLKVGAPGDVYEQEADQIAEQVMRKTVVVDGASSFSTELSNFRQITSDADSNVHESNRSVHALARKRRNDLMPTNAHSIEQAPVILGNLQAQSVILQRQAIPAPAYRDCTPAITGIADSDERLDASRNRARDFVGAAIRTLANPPVAGTRYATQLNRHFILNPPAGIIGTLADAAARANIRANYNNILRTLVVRNFICNSGRICNRTEQAFWIPDDNLIHVCPRFWSRNLTCRAIILIHEGAHDSGIDAAPGAHAPNRGSAAYPAGNAAPPAGQTHVARSNNADAFAFFAAHVWRDTDTGTDCF